METEFEFELPRGYVDQNGEVHRRGTMRLATAADEILPLRDARVQQNAGYLTIILLSRVITRLGNLKSINTRVIEGLFTMDLAYLQDLYQRINLSELPVYKITCPHCNQEIEVPLDFLLYQEMTFLSYYLHWSRDEVMNLNHLERRRWCREVSAVNKKLSNNEDNTFSLR